MRFLPAEGDISIVLLGVRSRPTGKSGEIAERRIAIVVGVPIENTIQKQSI